MPLFPRILIVPSARATEVAAALSGWPGFSLHPSSLSLSPSLPVGCRISMRKVKGYQRRDVGEFFVNSQAVCLSLPMIRCSLRCLRNAKGPSPSCNSAEDSRRRFSSSLTCRTLYVPSPRARTTQGTPSCPAISALGLTGQVDLANRRRASETL